MEIFSDLIGLAQFLVNFEMLQLEIAKNTMALFYNILQLEQITIQDYHTMSEKSMMQKIKRYINCDDDFIVIMLNFMKQIHTFVKRYPMFQGWKYKHVEEVIKPLLQVLLKYYFGNEGDLNTENYPDSPLYYLQMLISAAGFASVYKTNQQSQISNEQDFVTKQWCQNIDQLLQLMSVVIQKTILQIVMPSKGFHAHKYLTLYVNDASFVYAASIHDNDAFNIIKHYTLGRKQQPTEYIVIVYDKKNDTNTFHNNNQRVNHNKKRCGNHNNIINNNSNDINSNNFNKRSESINVNLNDWREQSNNPLTSSRFYVNQHDTLSEMNKQIQIINTQLQKKTNDIISKIDRVNEYSHANYNKLLSMLKCQEEHLQKVIKIHTQKAKEERQKAIEYKQTIDQLNNILQQKDNKIKELYNIIDSMQQQQSNNPNYDSNDYDDELDESFNTESEHDINEVQEFMKRNYDNDYRNNNNNNSQHYSSDQQNAEYISSNVENGQSSLLEQDSENESSSNSYCESSLSETDEDEDSDYEPGFQPNLATMSMTPKKKQRCKKKRRQRKTKIIKKEQTTLPDVFKIKNIKFPHYKIESQRVVHLKDEVEYALGQLQGISSRRKYVYMRYRIYFAIHAPTSIDDINKVIYSYFDSADIKHDMNEDRIKLKIVQGIKSSLKTNELVSPMVLHSDSELDNRNDDK